MLLVPSAQVGHRAKPSHLAQWLAAWKRGTSAGDEATSLARQNGWRAFARSSPISRALNRTYAHIEGTFQRIARTSGAQQARVVRSPPTPRANFGVCCQPQGRPDLRANVNRPRFPIRVPDSRSASPIPCDSVAGLVKSDRLKRVGDAEVHAITRSYFFNLGIARIMTSSKIVTVKA